LAAARGQIAPTPSRPVRGAGGQAIAAAIAARPVATVVVGRESGLAITLVGSDLLAVEVVARALRSAAQPVGDLGLSPWEAAVVQRGIERAPA
jgi:hypothetical protein